MALKIAFLSLVDEKSVYLLGNVTLATYIRDKINGVECRIIDANWENVIESVEKYNPDIICMSTVSVEYPKTIVVAEQIKQFSKALMIIGGLHISTFPKSLKKCFDLGVIGEAEETFEEIVKSYRENHNSLPLHMLKNIKGIVFFEGDNLTLTEKRPLIADIDKIPVPDLSLVANRYFKKRDLHTFKGEIGVQASMIISRGCPFECGFCASPVFWERKTRSFSVQRAVKEIKEYVEKYHVTHIQVYDDIFPLTKKRMLEMTEEMERQGILGKVKFACQMRAHMLDDEFCQILKHLGVATISFGFESGSDRMLKIMKTGPTSVEYNRCAATLAKKYGFYAYGSFIIGNPHETMEDIDQTFSFIKELKIIGVDGIDCFICSPLPGTAFWNYAISNGMVDMKNYEINPPDFMSPDSAYIVDKNISKEALIQKHREIVSYLETFSQRRSIKALLFYPKEPRLHILKKAVSNPGVAIKRLIYHPI